MKKIVFIIILILIIIPVATGIFLSTKTPDTKTKNRLVVIPRNFKNADIALKLKKQELIHSELLFTIASKGKFADIKPGGYTIGKDMNMWQIIEKMEGKPDMKWVTIPEGLRKEEIGERLQKELGWRDEELTNWNEKYTTMEFDKLEGVYFPDTYLIPVDENGLDIAKRFTNRFDENFAPYVDEFAKKDILWTTGLRFASVIQREAAGTEDMPLIAGILWNRLEKEQKLEIDATVQYARGKAEKGWWAPISPNDIKTIDSKYNTYKYKGLPPHPICNPGKDAIEAVLNPAKTDCIYYIHDNNRQIHCSKTYEGHKENIEKYLK